VDYWDYLGWRDPFGSKEFSNRQTRYAKARKQKNRWTPQLVVDGTILRKASGVKELVRKGAALKPQLEIEANATLKAGKIQVGIKLKKLDAELELGKEVKVLPILFQRNATTDCTAGENKGRKLVEHFTAIVTGDPVNASTVLEKGLAATFEAPKGVKAKNLGLAVLVEDGVKMKCLQCRAVSVKAGA
jgi:hypothetical protein